MKFIAAIAALCLAAVANAQGPVFSNCAGSTPTDMTITGFSIAPTPLCVGQQACATITGTLLHPVNGPGATLDVSGKYLGRVVYTDNLDLCTVLAAAGRPCPVPTTVTTITACILVKTSAPVGIPVSLQIKATNGDGHLLFCQAATVTAANCPV